MSLAVKTTYDATTLVALDSQSATSTGEDPVRLQGMVNAFVFTMDLTLDESTGADLLDVYVQTKADGTNWLDVVHFPQHAGDTGAARYIEKVAASPAFAGFENGSALGSGAVRDLIGDEWRVRFTVVDDSGGAVFTFSVIACPM